MGSRNAAANRTRRATTVVRPRETSRTSRRSSRKQMAAVGCRFHRASCRPVKRCGRGRAWATFRPSAVCSGRGGSLFVERRCPVRRPVLREREAEGGRRSECVCDGGTARVRSCGAMLAVQCRQDSRWPMAEECGCCCWALQLPLYLKDGWWRSLGDAEQSTPATGRPDRQSKINSGLVGSATEDWGWQPWGVWAGLRPPPHSPVKAQRPFRAARSTDWSALTGLIRHRCGRPGPGPADMG